MLVADDAGSKDAAEGSHDLLDAVSEGDDDQRGGNIPGDGDAADGQHNPRKDKTQGDFEERAKMSSHEKPEDELVVVGFKVTVLYGCAPLLDDAGVAVASKLVVRVADL